MKRFSGLLTLVLSISLFASTPKTITHNSKTDFERGTLENVTILPNGVLTPAPVIKKLIDTGEPFVWSLAQDSKGALYIGTGIDGRVFRVSAKGDTSLFFKAPELNVFAVAVDAADNVYAATSPNGKVYKIDQTGKDAVFFDPDAVYIWDLEFDKAGNLLVATGEKAFIYKISPDGGSSIIFQAEENHVRTMLLAGDDIYAGTSSSGFVYRISSGQQPFVLFDTHMKEVFGLAMSSDHYLYAAVSGETIMPMLPTQQPITPSHTQRSSNEQESGETQKALGAQTTTAERAALFPRSAPTSLFRISADGYGKDLWIGVDDKIQSLLADKDDGVIVGADDHGTLLRMNAAGDLSVLLQSKESHITTLLRTKKDRIVLGMSNLGLCYEIGDTIAKKASFESESIDAGLPANWGVMTWDGDQTKSAIFSTRSGNSEKPSKRWSAWQPIRGKGNLGRIASPAARFLQWKCEFLSPETRIAKVSVSYQQKNIAPGISSIIIHSPGDYYEPSDKADSEAGKGISFPAPLPTRKEKKGYRTIDWLFDDPNFDALTFDLYYRFVGENTWRQLAKNLNTNLYAWDSAQMMDGEYEIKVVAGDAPSNTEAHALFGEKKSRPFIIDNSAPQIEKLKPGNKDGKTVLTFRITDEWNPLKSVEYCIDAQEWKKIDPIDGILDSKLEDFLLETMGNGRQEIAVKAVDSIGNVRVVHKILD